MAQKAKEGRIKFVDVLAAACDEDLAEIRQQIEEQERDLAALLEARRRKIDALKAAAKVLEVQLHGRTPRKSPAAGEVAEETADGSTTAKEPTLPEQIFDLIAKEGPLAISQIAAHLGKTKQSIAVTVAKSNWFRRDGDEVCNA